MTVASVFIIAAVLVVAAFAVKAWRGNVSHKIDYEAMARRLDKLERTKAQKVEGRR